MTSRDQGFIRILLVSGSILAILASTPQGHAQQEGPVIIPRSPSDPSIHEGPSGRQSAGFRQVSPFLGLVPASYDWFGGIISAVGSLFRIADPRYLGYQSGQFVGYDFLGPIGFNKEARPDTHVKDVPGLGQMCGNNPGDPFWVGFPRPGNIEFARPFQLFHHPWDCYCRCNERIACPVVGPYLHTSYGGLAPHVPCQVCFSSNILKHDKFVGTDHGTFQGYPASDPTDSGYQECLRQSVESFAASGPGGPPQAPNIFGL